MRSHIIPEAAYRPAYDEKHGAIRLTVDKGRKGWLRKGLREPLLCHDCEQQFARYDDYFARVWIQGGRRPTRIPSEAYTVTGLDYRKFKLFHLSILWRAGVSTLPTFRHVRLGPHGERLRALLQQEDPGPTTQYPFWALALIDAQSRAIRDGLIAEPEPLRCDGHRVYTFIFGGCAWYYFVSEYNATELLQTNFTTCGEFTIGTQVLTEHPPLKRAFRRYLANAEIRARARNDGVR